MTTMTATTTTITPATKRKIASWSKETTVIHESGHLTVALVEGYTGVSCRVGETDKGWTIGATNLAGRPASPAVAVAGAAAVLVVDNPDITAAQCVDLIDCETVLGVRFLSDTDRSAYPAERSAQVAAFETALSAIRNNPEFLAWAVARLEANLEIRPDELRPATAQPTKPAFRIRVIDDRGELIGSVDSQTSGAAIPTPRLGEWLRIGGGDWTVTQQLFVYEEGSVTVQLFCRPEFKSQGESMMGLVKLAKEWREKSAAVN